MMCFIFYNTNYPDSVSSFIGLCQCQITTTGQSIQFYSIDIRLEKYGNECKQTLNITDSNGFTLLDCASATIFNVTKAAKTRAVTLTFKNDLPEDGGNIWIGFSSEEKETLRIECGYQMKQVTTESSTHNEVSSADPDGTITAIQSQTSTTTSITLTPTGTYIHQYSESDSGHFDTLSERTDTFDVTSTIIEATKMYTSKEESVATSYLQSSLSKITTTAFVSSTFTASRTSQYSTTFVNVSNTSRSPLLTQDMSSGSSNSQSRTSTSIELISPTTSSRNYQTSSNAGTLSDQQTIIIKDSSGLTVVYVFLGLILTCPDRCSYLSLGA
ncbi:uncharacterized protein LOC132754361 [Ruditapes philippinarum]|uniref:uncharacterized protein LOC132754361 n=1 Tax=Ruditapes philippinarum TaxID=129788 RepID=UPI00295BAFCA|nr:uncharacterized protein LOC132754361 [Ruditapes philippinarum]